MIIDTNKHSQVVENPRRIILGSGRSGTTWVLDCLARTNQLRPIFEPLHPKESKIGSAYANQVMVIDDMDESLERYFCDLASGSMRSQWIDYRGPKGLLFPNPARLMSRKFAGRCLQGWRKYLRDRKALASGTRRKETLIKCIRANLMAGWITQRLGFHTAMIIRHPCAAIESQIRGGTSWHPFKVLEQYKANRRLHEVTQGLYVELLDSKLTLMQALTLRWIIENQWPLERNTLDGYYVVCYEDLVSRPQDSWPALCESLALSQVPNAKVLRRPSQQASGTYIANHTDTDFHQSRWQSSLTSRQLQEIQHVFDATKFRLYNVDEQNPQQA